MKIKKTKEAISLIVLVLTIVIMLVLAGIIITNLSNSGIINRGKTAVSETNLKQVQELASAAWGEAIIENVDATIQELEIATKEKMVLSGMMSNEELKDYALDVTTNGVKVTLAEPLSAIVTSAADYGKTINYEANGVTEWKVFYHTDEYVYLIASKKLTPAQVPAKITADKEDGGMEASIDSFGNIYNWSYVHDGRPSYSPWMSGGRNSGGIIFLYENYWDAFKNTEKYGDYVVGAIGTPTAEMFVASWNAKGAALKDTTTYKLLEKTYNDYGMCINGNETSENISTKDDLYVWSTASGTDVWLATATGEDGGAWGIEPDGNLWDYGWGPEMEAARGMRPVVCIKSTIKAKLGKTTDGVDIVLN